jgi:major vault protein
MAAEPYIQNRDTELILPPGVFAFVQDQTKGHVNVLCGPMKMSLSNTDLLVVYDQTTGRFVSTTQQQAIQTNVIAPKGSYVILTNPQREGKQPELGKPEVMPIGTLRYGQIENLPGPQSFPLWPGQVANVVKGHHLRSNQYLMVRVYDDEAAKANWDKSVVKVAVTEGSSPADATKPEQQRSHMLGINKDTLVTGQLIVIRGTDVAFYIPPTGIEVLTDEDGKYVRDAVTLERLEYSILLGENGNKEYKIGPDVVFPTPTQNFYTKDNLRKFRAFELQPTTGIHVKVIADYSEGEGESEVKHKAGDELHITGLDMPIYYPRPEHAIISYGGQEKSFAVAIPGGEGRYVLDRKTGSIDLVEGPKMFLPNPITQVVVRRALSDGECELYYPGNDEVLRINRELRGLNPENFYGNDPGVSSYEQYASDTTMRSRSFAAAASSMLKSAAPQEKAGKGAFGDEMNRGTKYTPPRTITLNTKFDGAIRIDIWSGYAVQIVKTKGERKTIVGPQSVLLQYDEKLERLSLSKGKPKSSDNTVDTVYLKYISNPVSDILSLKTHDLVNVKVQVKYLVRFESKDKDKWFAVDNYVQYMVDHLRSLIGNTVRNIGVQEFYANAATILRDTVLGKKAEGADRPLHHFDENGMTVYDLELISITVEDASVATLLSTSRQETLVDSIKLDRAVEKLKLVIGEEDTKRKIAEELAETAQLTDELNAKQAVRQAAIVLAEVEHENAIKELRKMGEKNAAEIATATAALYLETKVADRDADEKYAITELDRKIKLLVEEASASETRMKAVQPSLVEALVALATVGQFEKIAEHLAPLSIVRGESLAGTLDQMFKGTVIEGMVENVKSLSKIKK